VVPLRAITGFADPSVQFGLQFSASGDEDAASEDAAPEPADKKDRKDRKSARSPARHEHGAASTQALPTPANPATAVETPAKPADPPSTGGEVVRLDRFRKK
jgi:uncharacterized protein